MYGRKTGNYHRSGGQNSRNSQFQNSTYNKFEHKNKKFFVNPHNTNKTSPEDSSFNVQVPSAYMMTSFDKNPIGSIKISEQKVNEIQNLLQELKPLPIVPYEQMKNSQFKHNFLEKRQGDMDIKMEFFMEKIERQTLVDQQLFMENNDKLNEESYLKMYEKRKKLPAFQQKNRIIKMIEDNQVVLISGDTGCGKTTQVPQFILDEYIGGYKGSACKIICTQPRRISAISVAERIASERAEPLGISCGYQIRLEKVLPRRFGSILFVTNGIVIRHMESDPSLNNISHLILDEIHERDIHSDFLLGLVKQLLKKRNDLKVILMSATLNEKKFREYFNFCPHVVIDGLAHPVEQFFLENVVDRLNYRFPPSNLNLESMQVNSMMFQKRVLPYVYKLESENIFPSYVCRELIKPSSEELNIDLIYKLTIDICEKEDEGAILIFVTGFDDIKKLYQLFEKTLPEDEYVLVALHSQIPVDEQKLVFEEPPPGVRKIIISTNIAETSITIDDVVYVIDSGWAKIKNYDPKTRTENLEARFISKANAMQRKGRAGRVRAGKCFHLYTKARFEAFYDYQKPEILRTRLESLMLQMKLLQLGFVKDFFDKLLDQPDLNVITYSLLLLNELGALDEQESLTPLGYYLAKLPINPQLGKMLLFGVFFSCLDPILNIAVGLDYKSPFILNLGRKEGDQKLVEFAEGIKSDHLLIHKALSLFQEVSKPNRYDFCREFNLNYEVMQMLKSLKKEFMENLMDLQLVNTDQSKAKEWNIYSTNIELIKSIVCAGLYPNIIIAGPQVPRMIFQTVNGNKVNLHKKSVLSSDRFFSCPLLSFYVKIKSRMDMVHDATVCSPFSLIFFGDKFLIEKTMHCNYIKIDTLKFICDKNVSTVMESLRDRLQQYLLFKLTNPDPTNMKDDCENKFVKVIVDLLASPEN